MISNLYPDVLFNACLVDEGEKQAGQGEKGEWGGEKKERKREQKVEVEGAQRERRTEETCCIQHPGLHPWQSREEAPLWATQVQCDFGPPEVCLLFIKYTEHVEETFSTSTSHRQTFPSQKKLWHLSSVAGHLEGSPTTSLAGCFWGTWCLVWPISSW